jgi:trimethylamine---corrinoid protein Co-methyltransferase
VKKMPKLYGSYDPFTKADYARLHGGTLRILENVGLFVDCDEVLEYAQQAGNKVDFEKKVVRFPGDVVERNLAGCRNSLDRRPKPDMLRFSCDGGTGVVSDYSSRRWRDATTRDVQDFSRLTDALENIDEMGFPVFPKEIPYEVQDITIFRHVWANTSKVGGGGLTRNGGVWLNTSPEAIGFLTRLAAIRFGGDRRPNGEPLISGFVGVSSPLRFDGEMMKCMLTLARMKQMIGIGSNVICGAQSPVSLAADVVMENAERLGALSLVMAVDPDAYVYFCNHPNFMDMATGNVANGSPEHSLMAMCATGLLRYYGFQLYVNHPVVQTGAHAPGTQAGVEKATHALLTGLSGASGVCACGCVNEAMSYEQLVVDNEIAGMVKHYLKGMDITDETMAVDVIEEMGIGANFLEHESVAGTARSVYWHPKLWNRKRYSEWIRENAKDALERAHERVEDILATHWPKPLTRDQESEMDELLREASLVLAGKDCLCHGEEYVNA